MDTGPPYPSIPPTDYPLITTNDLHKLSENRHFFYWLILTISVLAIIGNVLAIRSIIERKTKFLQKTCISALAISDILTVIVFSTNLLDMLSKQFVTWDLGEFLCYFIPYAQAVTTTASSLILLVIAMDRYQNVVHTFSKHRWDPKPATCILFILVLFILCAVIAYPMFTVFSYHPMWVVSLPISEKSTWQINVLCYASKSRISNYYVALDLLIFFPMVLIFIWFYIKIAILIWKHRKPITAKFSKLDKEREDSSSGSTKTTNVASNISVISNDKPRKQKNLQLERKIRTFRIVLVLIVSFVICRLPYWSFYTFKLLKPATSSTSWTLSFTLVSLNLLNCMLNPLLYTFLNQTVTAIRMIKDFLWKVCCCCCSNDEFEDFQRQNPFPNNQILGGCGPVKPTVRIDDQKPLQKY